MKYIIEVSLTVEDNKVGFVRDLVEVESRGILDFHSTDKVNQAISFKFYRHAQHLAEQLEEILGYKGLMFNVIKVEA